MNLTCTVCTQFLTLNDAPGMGHLIHHTMYNTSCLGCIFASRSCLGDCPAALLFASFTSHK